MNRRRGADLRGKWQEFSTSRRDADFRVGLAGTFTLDSLVPFLGATLIEAGVAPGISLASTEQVFQTCFDPKGAFGIIPHAIVLLWRIEDIAEKSLDRVVAGDKDSLDEILASVDALVDAVRSLRSSFAGEIVVAQPPVPTRPWLLLDDPETAEILLRLHRCVLDRWDKGLAVLHPPIRRFHHEAVELQYGQGAASDSRKWYLYRQPYSDGFLIAAAMNLTRTLMVSRRSPRKCVVVDCDDTLWGGIVGEAGTAAIELGETYPGNCYRDFQNALLLLKERGILLVIASKNNPEDVMNVFENHDGMRLRSEHISTYRINWDLKSVNIASIAKELNIGLDSMVFIDDNPVEIEEVRSALPEVACLLVPGEIADLPPLMERCGLFDMVERTAEDRSRAEMVTSEKLRTAATGNMTPQQFLASLEMRVVVSRAKAGHRGRAVQLINKTNQFNLTTIRRSLEALEELLSSGRHSLFVLHAEDRFGDYGLVGVAIVETTEDVWVIDTFLLSCRVLGRSVETAFLAGLVRSAKAAGAVGFKAEFRPTPKNAPIADFLPRHGFVQEAGGAWTALCADIASLPGYISMEIR